MPGIQLVYSLPRVGKTPKVWGFPIPLNPHNVAIVQRSWGLQHLAAVNAQDSSSKDPFSDPSSAPNGKAASSLAVFSYGPHFKYTEFARAAGPVSAFLAGIGMAFGLALLAFVPPVRWLVKRFGPQAGEGPSDE